MTSPRSLSPAEVERGVADGSLRLLDLRTWPERVLLGSPPGARHVSLLAHLLRPAAAGSVYLCAHAVRSKWTRRHGAVEVQGGFRRWRKEGHPIDGGLLSGHQRRS